MTAVDHDRMHVFVHPLILIVAGALSAVLHFVIYFREGVSVFINRPELYFGYFVLRDAEGEAIGQVSLTVGYLCYLTAILAVILPVIGACKYAMAVRRNGCRPASAGEMNEFIWGRWHGWVEVCGAQYQPLFQGGIVGRTDLDGIMLVGVLIEDSQLEGLVSGIKAQGEPTYLLDGKMLARCIATPDEHVIISELEDQAVIAALKPLLQDDPPTDLRLTMNVAYVSHMVSDADQRQFDEIWARSLAKNEMTEKKDESELSG